MDVVIEELARRLFELRYEWGDTGYISGNVSPSANSEFSFFSTNDYFGDDQKGHNWPKKKDDDPDFSYLTRITDTPNTWPTVNEEKEWSDCCYSHDSGVASPFLDGESESRKLSTQPYPMTDDEVNDWLKAFQHPKPGPGYVCRVCHQSDHYVQNCPRAPTRDEVKTPYQGHNQCYGLFSCSHCGHHWDSDKSWAELGQFCRRCKHFVYPYKQFPLEKVPPSLLQKRERRKSKAKSTVRY